MRKTLVAAAVASLAALGSSQSHAVPCTIDPFTDVVAGNANCSSVEWLKNRQVTLGCGGSSYCPDNNVTRIQMALFMQRLADAVAPPPLWGQGSHSTLTLTADPKNNVICQAPVALVGWPRRFIVHGQASFRLTTGAGNVGMHLLYTNDGNTGNWLSVTGLPHRTYATSTAFATTAMSSVLIVPAGTPTQVGIGLYSIDGNTTLADINCTRVVQMLSQTGSGTPFDEQD